MLLPDGEVSTWRFAEFSATSGPATVAANGGWNPLAARAAPLKLDITALDHALFQDVWLLAASDRPQPAIACRRGAGAACSTPGWN